MKNKPSIFKPLLTFFCSFAFSDDAFFRSL